MEQRQPIATDFFVYQFPLITVAPAAQGTANLNIQADSNFSLQKLTYFADIAAAAQTDSSRVVPLITLQLTDTGSGRNLFSTEVPVPSIFGEGNLPFILTRPKEFSANSTITVTVTNFDAAVTYNLRLSLIGQKLFYANR